MSGTLTSDELAVVDALVRKGLPRTTATLAVVMVTRMHARPEDELIEIVTLYQGLEAHHQPREALRELVRMGWLVEEPSYGLVLVKQAPDLRAKLADATEDAGLEDRLLAMRFDTGPYVTLLGPMNDKLVFLSFLDALQGASKEICMVMLATSPYKTHAAILQERADRGVRVRLILSSPEVLARLAGERMRTVAEERLLAWRQTVRGHPNMELRISQSVDDMLLATCTSIDSRRLRFDIYDHERHRSLQGVMLEVMANEDLRLNLVRLFQDRFEDIWERAAPATGWRRLGWRGRRWWRWALFAVLAVVASRQDRTSIAFVLLTSCGSIVLFDAVARSWSDARSFWRRMRR